MPSGGKGDKGGKASAGKGNSGLCFNCGQPGHIAANCPQPRQQPTGGKGGKGQFQGVCFNCGEWGHTARWCPHNNGFKCFEGAGCPEETTKPVEGAEATGGKGDFGSFAPQINLGGFESLEAEEWPELCEFEGSDWLVKGKNNKWQPKKVKGVDPVRVSNNFDALGELFAFDKHSNSVAKKVRFADVWDAPRGMRWKKVEATLDSGAFDHVTNKETLPQFQVKKGPQYGASYTVAKQGTEVVNEGEQHVRGKSEEGFDMELVFQVSQVHKTLLAVRKITKVGNKVVFDEEEGDYILNKAIGLKTKVHQKNGTYVVYVWVLEPVGELQTVGAEDSSVFRSGA